MARLVLLVSLMLSAVLVSAGENQLDIEHCSEGCAGHCGKKTSYITGKCVDRDGDVPSSYKATCTPGGAWKIEDYVQKGCAGASNPGLGGDKPCVNASQKLPVQVTDIITNTMRVKVKICPKKSATDESDTCDAGECKEYELQGPTASHHCDYSTEASLYYTTKITGDNNTATVTLGLYESEKLCEDRVAPIFYKEGMKKGECATFRGAIKGTCTPINPDPAETTNTSTEITGDNTNSLSGAVSSSLAAALLAVLAVLVALY